MISRFLIGLTPQTWKIVNVILGSLYLLYFSLNTIPGAACRVFLIAIVTGMICLSDDDDSTLTVIVKLVLYFHIFHLLTVCFYF